LHLTIQAIQHQAEEHYQRKTANHKMKPEMPRPTIRHSFFSRAIDLYVDGFRNMTVGRTLWALIILKIVLLLFVFKLIFFPDILKRDYDTDEQRAQAVRNALTEREISNYNNNQN